LWVQVGGRLEPLRPFGLAAGLFPGLVIAVRYTSPNIIDAAGCELLRDWGEVRAALLRHHGGRRQPLRRHGWLRKPLPDV